MNTFWLYFPTYVALAIHSAIVVTLISAIGLLASRACKRCSAPHRHALAVGVLLAVLVTPAFVWHEYFSSVTTTAVMAQGEPSFSYLVSMPQSRLTDPIAAGNQGGSEAASYRRVKTIVGQVLMALWHIGIVVMASKLVSGLWLLRKIKASFTQISGDFLKVVEQLTREVGLRHTPPVFSSPSVPSPITTGLFRPVVVIPEGMLDDVSRKEIEAVFIHELAHIRRRDSLVASLQQFISIVYWWNPLCAMLVSHLSNVAEEICDDFVANRGRARVLAQFLVSSAEKVTNAQFVLTSGILHEQQSTLEDRVQQLLSKEKTRMTTASPITKALTIAGVLAVAIFVARTDYALAQLTFSEPVNLGEAINSPGDEKGPWVSPDGLRIVFARRVPPFDQPSPVYLYEAIRSSRAEKFPVGTKLEGVDIAWINDQPSLTADGLRMVFPIDFGSSDFYETTRPSLDGLWSTPKLSGFSSELNVGGPSYFNDGLSMALRFTHETGNRDIYLTSRPDFDAPWSAPEPISERINTSAWDEGAPSLSNDGKQLIFMSNRDGGFGETDLYHSTLSDSGEWSDPINLGAVVNTSGYEHNPFLSYDGEELYFRSGGDRETDFFRFDLYVAKIVPEPSTSAMSICGVLLLMGFVQRRRSHS